MLPSQCKQPFPIEIAACAVNDVRDIRSVETFATDYEKFGRDEFLWRENPSRNPINDRRFAMLNPSVIDNDGAIAHACNEIYKKIITVSFVEPYWIPHLTIKPPPRKLFESGARVFRCQENVQIFGPSADASVLLKCKCPCNHKGNIIFPKGA